MSSTARRIKRLRPVDATRFEHINRGFDPRVGGHVVKIAPGEYFATSGEEFITTTLGSCVSACIWHPESGIGGMNHFMLPEGSDDAVKAIINGGTNNAARYGSFAMEHLINSLLATGLDRRDLVAKIVGGGHVLPIKTDIGARNIDFVRTYLEQEDIELIGEHVGGTAGRQVRFHPSSGKAHVKPLAKSVHDAIAGAEKTYMQTLDQEPPQGDVELF